MQFIEYDQILQQIIHVLFCFINNMVPRFRAEAKKRISLECMYI
ncbi:unnamed protein product [Paramecium octaurelia]|uniref:Uncharacterized protein n=1 Tax=Paramecium octaurelia TaxID=43137 RepID=A0A8S1Y284_PAROT|nr:unnamed protein product [Paramecium octaurelia]